MIYVCGLREMARHVRALRPACLISLLQPEEQPPTPPEIRPEAHLRLEIDDISFATPGHVLADDTHVARLIEFLKRRVPGDAVLIHCLAGISRSTAGALIALALDAEGREAVAARHLRAFAPHAAPNRRLIAVADRLLGRQGRLIEAREAMGPAEPALESPLVRLPRLPSVR